MQFNNKANFIDLTNFFLNLLFLTLIFLTIGMPIISWFGFIVVCFAIVIVVTGKLKFNLKKLIIAFVITTVSLALQFSFPKNIQEGFAIYQTETNNFF